MEEEDKIELSQLNADDIFGFMIISNNDNDAEINKLAYTTEITHWDSISIGIKFRFEDPTFINRGLKKDKMILTIKKKKLFVSLFTSKPIPKDSSSIIWTSLPNQLPKGMTETQVK